MSSHLLRISLFASVAFAFAQPLAHAADTLGPDVGKALMQAQSALAAHNYPKAMAAVDAADAVKARVTMTPTPLTRCGPQWPRRLGMWMPQRQRMTS